MQENRPKGFLDRTTIKYLVIILMIIDHSAMMLEERIEHISPFIMDGITFLSESGAPILAFFVAEGFMHSRNVAKYRRRMGICALITWLPCQFFSFGFASIMEDPKKILIQSILMAYYLALVALCVWYSDKFNKPKKIVLITLLCVLSIFTDMPIAGVLAPFFQCIYRNDRTKRYISIALSYAVIFFPLFLFKGWCAFGILLTPLFLIFVYNGKNGKKSAFNKWFFYIFFPLHFIILGIIRWYVLK